MKELTDKQLEQMNFVDNTIFDMLIQLTGNPDLPWDISPIGEIRDVIVEFYFPKEKDEYNFYPWVLDE